MNTQWKKIPNLSKYEASSDGQIRNYKTKRLIQPILNKRGYLQSKLSNDYGESKSYYNHRLVCETFIENADLSLQVNHINFIRTDNRITNLELVTPQENFDHSYLAGHQDERVAIVQKTKEGELLQIWPSSLSLTKAGFNIGVISLCLRGIRKTHHGFIWSRLS